MKGLDLSKFKKTAEDKHSTTLTHEDGHEVRVAHFKLKSKMKSDLAALPITPMKSKFKKMSGGGGVLAQPDPDKAAAMASTVKPTASDQAISQAVQHPIDTVKHALGFYKGGDTPPLVDPSSYGPNAPVPDVQADPDQAAKYAASQSAAPDQAEPQVDLPPRQPLLQVDNSGNISAPNGMPANSGLMDPAQPDAASAPTPVEQAPSQSQPQADQPQDQQQAQQPAQPADPKQQAFSELSQHQQDFQHDLDNGHITPKTYGDLFAQKSTLGKIGTIFGMILGGAGAGLTHQPNALLEMMNQEIGRDLEAQKASASNKQNMYKLNLEQQMNQAQMTHMSHENNLTDAQAKGSQVMASANAYALSRTQMNAAALHSLVQQVNQMPMGSPQRAAAEQQLAMVSQGVQAENVNLLDKAAAQGAFFKQVMGVGQSGSGSEADFQQHTNGLRMFGPQGAEKAKDLESKHMPGLQGQASVPLTAEDRTQLNSGMAFDKQLDRFIDFTKKNSGSLNPKVINEGRAMSSELTGAYRNATHGGVYKERENEFIHSMIDPNPTKFLTNVRVIPQLDALSRENKLRVDQFAKSKGFSGYSDSQQSTAPQTQTMGGVQYQKVNGGWQRVK